MPAGYALHVLLLAFATMLVVRPVVRPRWLARVGFLAGVVLNEVPLLALYVLVAMSALTLSSGDVRLPAGAVLVGVAALTAAALVVLFARALGARREVAQSLADSGCGPMGPRRWPWWRILFVPFIRKRLDVERVPAVRYGPDPSAHLLDIYRSRARPAGAPVLVHFHGGAYRSGRRSRQSLPLLQRLAARGWVCISASYRLQPGAALVDHVADAKRVRTWIHEQGKGYGADSSRVVVSGSSAGGHLAALSVLTAGNTRWQEPGSLGDNSPAAAAVLIGAWLGGYAGVGGDEAVPATHVRPDAPPFLVVHGARDPLAEVTQARRFVAELRSVSRSNVTYVELADGQHVLDLFHSPRFEAVIDAIEAFAACVLPDQQPTAPPL